MRQKLLDGPSLLRVLDEALFNEVSKAVTPLGWDALNRFVDYSVKQSLQVLSTIMERWITFSQLKREASERPHVNLCRVCVALGDLGRDPTWSAFLSLAILLLLGQEDAKAHVCYLDVALFIAENIV